MNGIFSNIPKVWNFKCLILNKWDHMSETWQRKPGLLDISMCNSCQLRDNYSMYWLALLVLWWSWVSILENLVLSKLLMMFTSIEFKSYFWRFPDVLFILDNKKVTSLLPREGEKMRWTKPYCPNSLLVTQFQFDFLTRGCKKLDMHETRPLFLTFKHNLHHS